MNNQDGNVLFGVVVGIGLEVLFLEAVYVVYSMACLVKQLF